MNLDQSKIDKLQSFFSKIAEETYPELISEPHLSITKQMFDYFNNKYPLPSNSKILDVGCGQGLALELFTEKGFNPMSITLNSEDYSVCKQKGYQVYQMDQSFLNFPDEEFNFVWCRHCLEHSIYNGPQNLDSVLSYTWEGNEGGPSGEFKEKAHTVI